jgi:hypothetical protein
VLLGKQLCDIALAAVLEPWKEPRRRIRAGKPTPRRPQPAAIARRAR